MSPMTETGESVNKFDQDSEELAEWIVKALGLLESRRYENQIFANDLASYDFAPPRDPEKQKTILEEAGEIVSGPRRKAYGHPKPNHDRIALFWSAYLKAKYENDFDLDAIDVVLMMDAVKTARLIESPDHRDSWVDKVGYSACGAIIEGIDPS